MKLAGQTEKAAEFDEPFRRVELIPPKSVSIVLKVVGENLELSQKETSYNGELMVEIVVSLSERDNCRDDVIPRSMAVVVWCIP